MSIPRMSDYDRKQQAQLISRIKTPQGGTLPESDRNVTEVGTGQLAVNSLAQQISYAARNKISTKITNLGNTEVFWGTIPSVSSTTGDLIPAGRGNWVTIIGGSVIFVVCASGVTGSISWAEAYETD